MKRIGYGLLAFLILLSLCVPAAAQTQPLLVDDAGLLTESEQVAITEELEYIRSEYAVDTVIVTVQSLYGESAQAYADDYYDRHGYGEDGILLLVAMEERQWYISTTGLCIDLVDAQELADTFLSELSDGLYYDALMRFALSCEKTVHVEQDSDFILTDSGGVTQQIGFDEQTLLICIGIGVVVGLITVLIMNAQLKSVKRQAGAGNYVSETLRLTRSADQFLYHTTTRREKPQNNTHSSSSGRSHGGGGGRF